METEIKRKGVFVLACLGDYHTLDIARELAKHGQLHSLYTIFSTSKCLAKCIPSRHIKCLWSIKISYLLLRIIFGPFKLDSIRLKYLYLAFDLIVAFDLLLLRYTHFCGWAGMSRWSNIVCRFKKAISLTYEGSAHIEEQRKCHDKMLGQGLYDLEFPEWQIYLRQASYDTADYIIVESDYCKSTFTSDKKNFNKVIKLTPGTDLKRFALTDNKFPEIPTVTMVGPICRKGAHDLINAMNDTTIPIKLILIGRIDSAIEKMLVDINNQKLTVVKHNYCSPEKIAKILNNTTVFMMPTYWDGSPRALLEALSCGCPVICSSNSIGPEIIQEGISGWIINAGDINAIYEKLFQAIKVAADQRINKLQIRSMSSQKLDWNANFSRFIGDLLARN